MSDMVSSSSFLAGDQRKMKDEICITTLASSAG